MNVSIKVIIIIVRVSSLDGPWTAIQEKISVEILLRKFLRFTHFGLFHLLRAYSTPGDLPAAAAVDVVMNAQLTC